jgi:uncharacterized protein involved in exopolysaccharide biosynthesis
MSSDMFPEHHLTKGRLLELLRQYWRLVACVFVAGTLAMYALLPVFFTDLYESNTQLLVRVGRENAETPTTVQRGEVFSQGVRAADINSEVQMLTARALVERVVDRLGPDAFKSVPVKPDGFIASLKFYTKMAVRAAKNTYAEFLIAAGLDKRITPRETAILSAEQGIKVEPIRDSDILVLKVLMPSPELCLAVATTLLDVYLQRRVTIRRGSAGSEFFAARLKEASARLGGAQQVRAGVRARYRLTAPEEQRSLYLRALNNIDGELVQNRAEIAKLEGQRDRLIERADAMPDLVTKEKVDGNNPSIQSIKDRITTLRVDRAKVASRYQSGSETMLRIDEEIAALEASLAPEHATILNSVTSENNPAKRDFRNSIELQGVQMAGLANRNQFLRAPAARLVEQLRTIQDGMDALEMAERDYRLAEQEYLAYAKRLDEARMSEELDSRRVANVTIAAPPETPIKPMYPRRLFLMEIAMAVSLLVGIALAAFLETAEDRILDERAVLGLGNVAYLGTAAIGDSA